MNSCEKCGTRIEKEMVPSYRVPSLGIPVVIHNSATLLKCACKSEAQGIVVPDMEGLIAAAAVSRVLMPSKLNADDILFLRKALEVSAKDLAQKLEVTPETISRWENGKVPIGPGSEKLLRLFVGIGLSPKAPGISFDEAEVMGMRIHSVRGTGEMQPIMLMRAIIVNKEEKTKQEKYTEALAA